MKKEKLIVVGNGMTGVRCVEEILKINPNQFDISIIGNEPHPNYNRILLSNLLVEKNNFSEIITHSYEWYESNNINLVLNKKIENIDVKSKTLYTDLNESFKYDKLIIATGSNPFMLPIPGVEKDGVIAFRNIKDCDIMMESAKKYKKAVVIGAGLLGLEAARGLIHLGMEVEVVHISSNIMNQQLDETSSKMLQEVLESKGMRFLMNKETVEIFGNERVEGIRFKDGSSTSADLVVMAIGIRPNTLICQNTPIKFNKGIVVNDYMQTTIESIYAIGECTEHRERTYGLVAPLYEQGKILAKHICGISTNPYEGSLLSAKLKVSEVDVFSVGRYLEDKNSKVFKIHNEFLGIYKKIVMQNNKIVGAVLFGDTKDSAKITDYIQKQTDVSEMMNSSIFSMNTSNESVVMSYKNSDIVCGCNGVTKGMIVDVVKGGCSNFDEVKSCTKAANSCGGCAGLVTDIMKESLGGDFQISATAKPICSCTTLTREEVLNEIKEKGLTQSKEVRMVLGWENEDGCSKCRPALNYYLGMIYPIEHEDEKESRLVNERLHANIQKDGTYGVIPRMYGGVTNPKDLKKIAEVAEKYEVPLIKVTGAQRLNLLGVKKEDLPNIWEELGMPSGYGYGKSLRMVKTCVGKEFCRFGTQDSMSLGIAIEKKFEGLQSPHKLKIAVSACPRNCAESGIKDVGIVGLDGCWEIYVGGNGGVHLRGGDLLYKVKTEQELIDITSAFLQYYREDADYLERTSAWVERVGLEKIKEVLDDLNNRNELIARMELALSTHKDPWKEIIESEELQKELFEVVKISNNN